jgi:hypothetical protein
MVKTARFASQMHASIPAAITRSRSIDSVKRTRAAGGSRSRVRMCPGVRSFQSRRPGTCKGSLVHRRPDTAKDEIFAFLRNEALDVRVYATAARAILKPNYEAIARRRLQHTEVADRDPEPMETAQPAVEKSVEKPVNINKKKLFLVKNNPFSGGYKP